MSVACLQPPPHLHGQLAAGGGSHELARKGQQLDGAQRAKRRHLSLLRGGWSGVSQCEMMCNIVITISILYMVLSVCALISTCMRSKHHSSYLAASQVMNASSHFCL